MLSKQTFIDAIEKLKILSDAELALYNASDSSIQLYTWKPFSDIMEMYVRLIEEAMNIEVDEKYGSDISYFIYKLEFGNKWTPESITTSDGKSIDISTAEKLYDYIISEIS